MLEETAVQEKERTEMEQMVVQVALEAVDKDRPVELQEVVEMVVVEVYQQVSLTK